MKYWTQWLFLLIMTTGCFSQKEASESEKSQLLSLKVDQQSGLSQEKIIIKTVHGNISIHLYPQKAPNTVKRIIELTNQGFYDGLTFHRVVPKFVVQTGDPTASGTGGSGKSLKAEFNDVKHIKGSVAMARSSDVNSADSQFYIMMDTFPHLDRKYTIFGQVSEGMDVVDKIQVGDKILSMIFKK